MTHVAWYVWWSFCFGRCDCCIPLSASWVEARPFLLHDNCRKYPYNRSTIPTNYQMICLIDSISNPTCCYKNVMFSWHIYNQHILEKIIIVFSSFSQQIMYQQILQTSYPLNTCRHILCNTSSPRILSKWFCCKGNIYEKSNISFSKNVTIL